MEIAVLGIVIIIGGIALIMGSVDLENEVPETSENSLKEFIDR